MTDNIIDFGNGFKIDPTNERWATQGIRGAIAASSGSGKSYLVSVFLEEMTRLGMPWLMIDSENEYRGVKEVEPGRILLVSRKGGDINFKGEWIDQVLHAIDKGTGVIVDLYRFVSEIRLQIYTELLTRFLEHQQMKRDEGWLDAAMLVVEEAHIYAPQTRAKSKEALEITIEIAQRGRKAGIFTMMVTQRPHALIKEVLSQANLRLIGRLEERNDFKAVESILPKSYINPWTNRIEQITLETLMHLGTGEFFLRVGPNFHRLARVKKRRSKDMAATPILQSK